MGISKKGYVRRFVKLFILKAGLEVYKFYLNANNGNKKKALLEFKGVEKSKKVKEIVDKILVLEKEIR